jgi:hypothetical protein
LDRRCHFKHIFTQKRPVLILSNEHGSQAKAQGRRQCCHNKHKKFPYRPTRVVSLLSGLVSYEFFFHQDYKLSHVVLYFPVLRDYNWLWNCVLFYCVVCFYQ